MFHRFVYVYEFYSQHQFATVDRLTSYVYFLFTGTANTLKSNTFTCPLRKNIGIAPTLSEPVYSTTVLQQWFLANFKYHILDIIINNIFVFNW